MGILGKKKKREEEELVKDEQFQATKIGGTVISDDNENDFGMIYELPDVDIVAEPERKPVIPQRTTAEINRRIAERNGQFNLSKQVNNPLDTSENDAKMRNQMYNLQQDSLRQQDMADEQRNAVIAQNKAKAQEAEQARMAQDAKNREQLYNLQRQSLQEQDRASVSTGAQNVVKSAPVPSQSAATISKPIEENVFLKDDNEGESIGTPSVQSASPVVNAMPQTEGAITPGTQGTSAPASAQTASNVTSEPAKKSNGKMTVEDRINAVGGDFAEKFSLAYGTYSDQAKDIIDSQNKAVNEQIGVIADSNKATEASFYDLINRKNEELAQTQQENDILNQAETRRNTWAAATEVASSLANLVGTAKGASNQSYKLMTADWMKQTDANRKYRQERLDRIKEKQQAAEEQLALLKQSNANSLAQMKMSAVDKKANNELGVAKSALDFIGGLSETEAKYRMSGIEASIQQSRWAQQDARTREQLVASMMLQGYVPDASSPNGWSFDEDTYRKVLGAKNDVEIEKIIAEAQAKGGSDGSNINITVQGNSTNGEPVVLKVKPESLRTNIYMHINNVTDLSDADKKAVNSILNNSYGKSPNEVSQMLTPYLNKSRQLLELVTRSASGTYIPAGGVSAPQASSVVTSVSNTYFGGNAQSVN